MTGTSGKPILIVNRVQKGRVAQLTSDQIWLWARGLGGGGPHAELLRRLAHWLMKEPELEENALRARMEGNKLAITRRSVDPEKSPVEVTTPSGKTTSVTLSPGIGGRARALIPVAETGIYKVTDRNRTALAAVGTTDQSASTDRAVKALRDSFPDLKIFVRARDLRHRQILTQEGATSVVPEALEASIQLAGIVLRAVGTSVETIDTVEQEFRRDDYLALEEIQGND